MSFISENYHKEKLNKFNINIKTNYIVGNEILERNTDNSKNDDIKNGIRCQKYYYINNELRHTENEFDSRIEYTFISKNLENNDYTCPNCGVTAKLINFVDGCPYCKTYYNIDYSEKELGSKHHYDQILRSNTYKIITAIIDVILSISLSFIFIKLTSRTFNGYDISKVFVYGIILSCVLYYLFYIADAYIVLSPIKKYKKNQNQKQIDFWNKTKIDKKQFFNNLNYEIRKYYYSNEDIIDYDVIDYISFKEFAKNNTQYVEVIAEVRIVRFKNNKIVSKYKKDKYLLRKNNNTILELNEGANIIKCNNCGSSIDASVGHCEYCGTEIKSLQEWILVK